MMRYIIQLVVVMICMGFAGTAYALQTAWNIESIPWDRHTIDASSRGADGVKINDVNGDGLLDVVTGWEEGGVVKVYVHPGGERVRMPWPGVVVGRVPHVEDAMFIDADGAGVYDVVSAAEGDERTLYMHRAPRNKQAYLDSLAWEMHPFENTRGYMQWMFAIPFDVGGDGAIEVLAAGKNEGAEIGWLDGTDPARAQWHPLAPVAWVMSIIPTDLDRDGDLDILYTDRKGPGQAIYLLKQEPGGAFLEPERLGEGGVEYMFMALGDVNGDQQEDIVAATSRDGIHLLLQHEAGWATEIIPFPNSAGTGKGVAIGDLTGDGEPEIAVTTEHAGGTYGVYYLKRGDSGWGAVDIGGLVGTKFDRIELVDLDADGDLDLLTCEEVENLGVIWYENPAL